MEYHRENYDIDKICPLKLLFGDFEYGKGLFETDHGIKGSWMKHI
jgi:hypothetical protein